MKLGVVLTWQNHEADWERYETGEFSKPPAIADWKVYEENRYLGDLVEPLGFDSLFAVELVRGFEPLIPRLTSAGPKRSACSGGSHRITRRCHSHHQP